jgi:N-acetylneuraminic acid mutarotase
MPYTGNHLSFVTAKDANGNERHYFSGGQEQENEYDGNKVDHYEYIPATDTWVRRQNLPMSRGHTSSSTRPIGCGYIVVGGCTNAERLNDVTYYDIATDTWTKIGELPVRVNTPVCDIHRPSNTLYCETGYVTGKLSFMVQMAV